MGHFRECHIHGVSGLRMNCSYSQSSFRLGSDSNGKLRTRRARFSDSAVSESHTMAAVSFNPRCQPGFVVSRTTRQSEWNPAAISMVRAFFRKGAQPEAIPTRAVLEAGR